MNGERYPLTAVPEDAADLAGIWQVEAPPTPEGHRVVAASYCTEADARLFAAAPDLLQAAKRVLNVLRATGESVRKYNALGALQAAISKAEGPT